MGCLQPEGINQQGHWGSKWNRLSLGCHHSAWGTFIGFQGGVTVSLRVIAAATSVD